jgi:hypothetical protein
VAANGPTLVTEVAGELAAASDNFQTFMLAPYIGLLLIALVPLAVLAYTIRSRPRATQPIEPAVMAE